MCEVASRAIYQLDCGTITHSQLPGELCEKIEDTENKRPHTLAVTDRHHLCKAIGLVYKFRSARGPVHVSPNYTANYMDSMLVLHVAKWILAEFLRIAWNADREVIAETIANKELRTAEDGALALTPNGHRALTQEIIPKCTPH